MQVLIHTYLQICVYNDTFVHVCTFSYTFIRIYIYTYIWVTTGARQVIMQVIIYVFTYICIYIYTHPPKNGLIALCPSTNGSIPDF